MHTHDKVIGIPPQVLKLIPRFASDDPHELSATRNAISRVLRSAGWDWHDLAAACVSSLPSPELKRAEPAPQFFDLARACRDLDKGILTSRERAFVSEMVRRGRMSPSPKQARWLGDIYGKIQDELAA